MISSSDIVFTLTVNTLTVDRFPFLCEQHLTHSATYLELTNTYE